MTSVILKPRLHRDWIDPQALKIVESLQKHGHESYLVGGCVRDLLAGIPPKDFDIATSAHPEQVRRIIPGSNIIGRRFRLVLVRRHSTQFEIATFRRLPKPEDIKNTEEPFSGENFFGTCEEDALRRDFTLNALFYDPTQDRLVDHVGGVQDIENGIVRTIGDPCVRIPEDPIRSLRAIRLSHKLGFTMESSLRAAISEFKENLLTSVLPRRREEYLKLLKLPEPSLAFAELADLGLLSVLIPSAKVIWENPQKLEIFLRYLDFNFELIPNESEPGYLFFVLCLSLLRAWTDGVNSVDDLFFIPEEKVWDELLRNELGMFKTEQMYLQQTLSAQSVVLNRKAIEKKSPKRRRNILNLQSLPVAEAILETEGYLGAEDLLAWSVLKKNALHSPTNSNESGTSE